MELKKIFYFIFLALLISSCGGEDDTPPMGDDGDVELMGCDALFESVAGQNFSCNDAHANLVVNNVYIEVVDTADLDNDGVDDHTFIRLHFTDGTATIDADDNFVSMSTDRTYSFEVFLYALGTDGLQAGIYKPLAFVDVATEPYYSLGGVFSDSSCNPDFLGCSNGMSTIGGVVEITGAPGSFDICVKAVVDFDNNCFDKNYNGPLIPVKT